MICLHMGPSPFDGNYTCKIAGCHPPHNLAVPGTP